MTGVFATAATHDAAGAWDAVSLWGRWYQKTAKLMVVTLVRAASKTWRKLNGTNRLPVRAMALTIEGVRFTDGIALCDATESRPA